MPEKKEGQICLLVFKSGSCIFKLIVLKVAPIITCGHTPKKKKKEKEEEVGLVNYSSRYIHTHCMKTECTCFALFTNYTI